MYHIVSSTTCYNHFQFIVIKVRLEDKNGRKANVSARVEDLKGNLLVEAK